MRVEQLTRSDRFRLQMADCLGCLRGGNRCVMSHAVQDWAEKGKTNSSTCSPPQMHLEVEQSDNLTPIYSCSFVTRNQIMRHFCREELAH